MFQKAIFKSTTNPSFKELEGENGYFLIIPYSLLLLITASNVMEEKGDGSYKTNSLSFKDKMENIGKDVTKMKNDLGESFYLEDTIGVFIDEKNFIENGSVLATSLAEKWEEESGEITLQTMNSVYKFSILPNGTIH